MSELNYKFVVNTLQDVIGKNKKCNMSVADMLKEYGYDPDRNYNKKQMFFINYAIKNFNGLKNKLRATVSLFIVGNITKYIVSENPGYEELGRYCYDILEDCEIIKISRQ